MKQKLGKVSISPKGEWNNATAYECLDTVNFGGGSWLAKRANTAVSPVEGDDWMQLSAKGADAEVTKDSIVEALGYEPEKDRGDYELIEKIVLTEDVISVRRSQEPNGTPYDFHDVIVLLTAQPAAKTAIVSCTFNTGNSQVRNDAALTTSATYTRFSAHVVGGIVACDLVTRQYYSGNPMTLASYPAMPFMYSVYPSNINEIWVDVIATTEVLIPAGSTIEIYAVRT